MNKPLISILTPFKNTSVFISECIESIQKQTYTNWELLIVDDHSTDTSYAIVNEYARFDSRITLIKNNGQGIIEALRLAFSLSKGNLITRMDSDDIMHKDKLMILSSQLIEYGSSHIAIGQVKYFSDLGISEGYAKYQKWLNTLTAKGSNYKEIYKECVIPSPCWMVYRNDLIRCNAFNPNDYPEDYDLTFRFYKYQIQCIPCNSILHYWRDYPTRTSRTSKHYEQNYFLEIKIKYFLALDYNNSRSLSIWGAGNKGKTIAKLLVKNKIPFYWICNNPKKIGKVIYEQELKPISFLEQLKTAQSIITVSNEDAQKEIKAYFNSKDLTFGIDYFFFC